MVSSTNYMTLKALYPYIMSSLAHNELISSKMCRKYGLAQYHGIVHRSIRRSNACSIEDICDDRVEAGNLWLWMAKE